MTRTAHVFYQHRLAGTLTERDDGTCRFAYDPAFLEQGPAISLTLPLRREPYHSPTLFPFFAGLVPEGWYLRLTSAALKIDEKDTFGLLLHTCQDCIGAVSLREATDVHP